MRTGSKILTGIAALTAGIAFAGGDVIWKGADGGSWNTPSNWSPERVPGDDDVPVFNPGAGQSASVTLDTGDVTPVKWLNVKSGTVTLGASDGSALRFTGAADGDKSGLTVAQGAVLNLECPLDLDIRFDRWGSGTVHYRSSITNVSTKSSYIGYGTNIFERGSTTTFRGDTLSLGLGGKDDGVNRAVVELRDNATLSVTKLSLSANKTHMPMDFIVNGDEAVANVTGDLQIGAFADNTAEQRVYVKKGTLTVGNNVYVGHVAKGAWIHEGGTATVAGNFIVGGSNADKTRTAAAEGRLEVAGGTLGADTLLLGDCASTTFRQTGGTVVAPTVIPQGVASTEVSFRLEGGRFECDTLKRLNSDARGEVMLELAGGTFVPRLDQTLPEPILVDGPATIEVPDGKTLTLDRQLLFTENAALVKSGAGTIKVKTSSDQIRGSIEVSAGRIFVDAGVNLSSPKGWAEPLGLTIRNGASFELYRVTSRMLMPLDLTIEEGGCLHMTSSVYTRSIANLRSYTYKGVKKTDRGRIAASSDGMATGIKGYNASASVVLPTVWTGKAGDNKWHTPGNWDTEAVPHGGVGPCADISAATEIVLDQDVVIGCLVYSPNSGNRKVTLRGDKKLYLGRNTSYEVGMFVAPDAEVVLDVDFCRSNDSISALVGGGTIRAKKSWPAADGSGNPLLSFDCKPVLEGVKQLNLLSGKSGYNFLTAFSQGGECASLLTIGEGTDFTAASLRPSNSGYVAMDGVRQIGGKVTFTGSMIMTRHNDSARTPFGWILEGGELVGTDYNMGGAISGSWTRYPGAQFIMTGGTATFQRLTSSLHEDYARLTGGTLNLSGAGFVIDKTWDGYDENEKSWQLGGVKIVANRTDSTADATWFRGNVLLTGENGDTRIVCNTTKNVAFSNGTVTGPGGMIKEGEKTLTFGNGCAFTGGVEVRQGACMVSGAFNGPSAIKVTGGCFYFNSDATAPKSPETIDLASNTSLEINDAGITLNVKRLTIGGVDQGPGEYTFKSGKVVVVREAGTWAGGANGDWSGAANWEGGAPTDSASFMSAVEGGAIALNLDEAATLSALTCAMPGTATLTLAGANALTLADGAVITVGEGNTLVLDAAVKVGGKVRKVGAGTVVFNGGIAADAADPATVNVTPYWLIAEEGAATVNCAVTGVRVNAGNASVTRQPVLTLGAQAQVGANSMVFAANTFDLTNGVAGANYGEIRQTGGVVDYSAGLPSGMTGYRALTDPNGGAARYVLEDGTFTTGANTLALFRNAGGTGLGAMEFVQNGGVSEIGGQLMLARGSAVNTLTLNGGTMNLGQFIAGAYNCSSTVNLNGGTLKTAQDGAFLGFPVRTVVGGTVGFEQTDASVASELSADLEGEGTIVQKGPGRLVLSGRAEGVGVYAVEGGELELAGELSPKSVTVAEGARLVVDQTAADAFDGTCELSVASRDNRPVAFNFTGVARVRTLTVGGRDRWAGYYDESMRRVDVPGKACLQVMEGVGTGLTIIVR